MAWTTAVRSQYHNIDTDTEDGTIAAAMPIPIRPVAANINSLMCSLADPFAGSCDDVREAFGVFILQFYIIFSFFRFLFCFALHLYVCVCVVICYGTLNEY